MSQPASPHVLSAAGVSDEPPPRETQQDICGTESSVLPQSSPHISHQSREAATTNVNANMLAARVFLPPESHFVQQAAMTFDSRQLPPQSRYLQDNFTRDVHAFGTPVCFTAECIRNDVHPPSTFYHSQPGIHTTPSLPDTSLPETTQQLDDNYGLHYAGHINQEDQAGYYSDMSYGTNFYPSRYEERNPIDKELPYAQLIHRALLSAPNHTMVLRDIYAWFERYTDKAAHSETRGWQNSIRHNLSMNGAFEKVDLPADATTKGFMWRLTPAALREGVKSTTRYRSKAKRSSSRSQPLPQRQASGAKGGNASRRAASNRRAQRARELSRHGPTSGAPHSGPHNGYSSDFREETPYSSPSSYPSRSDTPYSHMSYSPYDMPDDDAPFSPMPGMASHLLSSAPVTPAFAGANTEYDMEIPAEPLFAMPSADQQVDRTTFVEHPLWTLDAASSMDMVDQLTNHANIYYADGS